MRLDFRRWVWVPLMFLLLASFTGCASLGQGFGEAVLQSGEKQDIRQCWIRGRAFPGTLEAIALQERAAAKGRSERSVLKVMMVHGIGSHVPGYSTRMAENIAGAMSLDRVQEKFKEFQLSSTKMAGQDLGVLRVTRYLDQAGVQEMLFYELTWDSIVEAEKQTITFDNAGEYSFRRAGFNDKMKRFVNDTVPDVLMYNGRFRKPIQFAVGQSICWMMSEDWSGLPSGDRHSCVGLAPISLDHLDDEFVFITHSLGSRITVDALQTIAVKAQETPDFQERARARALQDIRISVIMLSNQIPLLQLGQAAPEVYGQIDAICRPDSPRADERLFQETRVVAFSDPNDLFSYAIPAKFLDVHMDSRLCPTLTNVILNIAPATSLLGMGEFANPMTAHLEYDNDERVIALITQGLDREAMAPMILERCDWIEAVPAKE